MRNWASIQPGRFCAVRVAFQQSVAAIFRRESSQGQLQRKQGQRMARLHRSMILHRLRYLCSDQSAYMTGQVLNVDGGILMP